jgi:hypothetical protein
VERGELRLEPWERQPGESAAAFAAFRHYLELGPTRTLIAVARQLGKNRSLIYRWGERHGWMTRGYVYDLTRARDEEALSRQAREEMAQRLLKDAEGLQKLSMAAIRKLVRRDPETNELMLSEEVDYKGAIRLYRLALDLHRHFPALPPPTTAGPRDPEEELQVLSDEELTNLIRLAKERAGTLQEESHDQP